MRKICLKAISVITGTLMMLGFVNVSLAAKAKTTATAVCYIGTTSGSFAEVAEVDIFRLGRCEGVVSSDNVGCGEGTPCVICLHKLRAAGMKIIGQSGAAFPSNVVDYDFHSTWYTLTGRTSCDWGDEEDES